MKKAETKVAAITKSFDQADANMIKLHAHMNGAAGSAEEWQGQLLEEISAEEGAVKRAAIVGAKSRLEQEAAIGARFDSIKRMVAQDANGISDRAQHVMSHLADVMKQEALRITSSSELSEEQQLERLEKMDAFLASKLKDVASDSGTLDTVLESAAGAETDFEHEAAEHAAQFVDLMEKADEADGVQHLVERFDIEPFSDFSAK